MNLPCQIKKRRESRQIMVGDVAIGGDAPISVQSMTNTDTRDVSSTLAQVKRLQEAGADLVRISVPDEESLIGFEEIKKKAEIPLIADIHFDYRLAIEVIKKGAD